MIRRVMIVLGVALLMPLPALAASTDPEDTGTWFDGLDAGVCFDDAFDANGDFDFSIPPLIVPCDGPHGNEVVSRVPLGDGDYTSEDEMVGATEEACRAEWEAFLGRPIESALMAPFAVAPDADDWAAGAHDGLCMLYAGEQTLGTAASGSLRAPGEKLAVYHEVDEKPDIWLVDAGTGETLRNITDNDLVELITAPYWTPDGTAITFPVETGADREESDIYTVSLADGTATPLVTGPAREDGGVFSPDGSTLAYIAASGDEEYEIYTKDLASGEITRLTTYEGRDSTPQWSPDGSKLAFRRRADGVSDIWLMNPDGSDLQQLTSDAGNNYDPRWSPDGSRIAFTTDRAGNFDIGAMDADGSGQALLTTHPADDEYPTWSSDGSVIAFHSSRYGGVTLWLMNADGTEQSELAGVAPMGYPMFAPVPVE